LSRLNEIHHLSEHRSVRGNRISTQDCFGSAPIGKGSARFFNHRKQGSTIPEVHHRIQHHFGPPCSDQDISIAIAPGSICLCSSLELIYRTPKSVTLAGGEICTQ